MKANLHNLPPTTVMVPQRTGAARSRNAAARSPSTTRSRPTPLLPRTAVTTTATRSPANGNNGYRKLGRSPGVASLVTDVCYGLSICDCGLSLLSVIGCITISSFLLRLRLLPGRMCMHVPRLCKEKRWNYFVGVVGLKYKLRTLGACCVSLVSPTELPFCSAVVLTHFGLK